MPTDYAALIARIDLFISAFSANVDQELDDRMCAAKLVDLQTLRDARTALRELQAENEQSQQVVNEGIQWALDFASGERQTNGEYAHLLICSGSRQKPTGSSGCVCNPRLKAAEARAERAEAAKETS